MSVPDERYVNEYKERGYKKEQEQKNWIETE
jgi:hypothetical protein